MYIQTKRINFYTKCDFKLTSQSQNKISTKSWGGLLKFHSHCWIVIMGSQKKGLSSSKKLEEVGWSNWNIS